MKKFIAALALVPAISHAGWFIDKDGDVFTESTRLTDSFYFVTLSDNCVPEDSLLGWHTDQYGHVSPRQKRLYLRVDGNEHWNVDAQVQQEANTAVAEWHNAGKYLMQLSAGATLRVDIPGVHVDEFSLYGFTAALREAIQACQNKGRGAERGPRI